MDSTQALILAPPPPFSSLTSFFLEMVMHAPGAPRWLGTDEEKRVWFDTVTEIATPFASETTTFWLVIFSTAKHPCIQTTNKAVKHRIIPHNARSFRGKQKSKENPSKRPLSLSLYKYNIQIYLQVKERVGEIQEKMKERNREKQSI